MRYNSNLSCQGNFLCWLKWINLSEWWKMSLWVCPSIQVCQQKCTNRNTCVFCIIMPGTEKILCPSCSGIAVCLFNQDLGIISRRKSIKPWAELHLWVNAVPCLLVTPLQSYKPIYYRYSSFIVCTVSPLCVVCVSIAIFVTVRNFFFQMNVC
jgi:hypothetical protein